MYPALTLGSGSPEVITSIVNQVLSPITLRPASMWENLPLITTSLDVLGLMAFPVVSGSVSFNGVTRMGDFAYTGRTDVASVDCSVGSAGWLDPSHRPSAVKPFYAEEHCRTLAESSCTADDCLVRFAYGKDGNCMICGQLPFNASSADKTAQQSSNSDSVVISFERSRASITFNGQVDITAPDGVPVFAVTTGVPADLRLGHVFEYRTVFLPVKSLKNVAQTCVVRGSIDQRRQKADPTRARAFIFKENEGTLYGPGSSKVKSKGEVFLRSQDARLQLRGQLALVGMVPSPQSELSGTTSFGKFVWRGQLYETKEIEGQKSFEKRRSASSSKSMTVVNFAQARNCEKSPYLAII